MKLGDKTTVVTGAGSGIGRVLANRFAREGARVIVTDLDGTSAEETADRMPSDGATPQSFELDVRDGENVRHVLETVHGEHGGLDVLVNNAGIGNAERFEAISSQQLDDVIDTNVRGVWNCCREAVPLMLESGEGAIVNMASIGGFIGMKYQSHYCLSKGAILNLTRALAVEFGEDGIRVNAVCPGSTRTERTERKYNEQLSEYHDGGLDGEMLMKFAMEQYPLKRFADPDEVAACAAFLASDDASFVTGHGLVVDGGYSVS